MYLQSGLPGFYDPCVGEEKSLKVLYQFRGVMHQVLSGDVEALRIPKQCRWSILCHFVICVLLWNVQDMGSLKICLKISKSDTAFLIMFHGMEMYPFDLTSARNLNINSGWEYNVKLAKKTAPQSNVVLELVCVCDWTSVKVKGYQCDESTTWGWLDTRQGLFARPPTGSLSLSVCFLVCVCVFVRVFVWVCATLESSHMWVTACFRPCSLA